MECACLSSIRKARLTLLWASSYEEQIPERIGKATKAGIAPVKTPNNDKMNWNKRKMQGEGSEDLVRPFGQQEFFIFLGSVTSRVKQFKESIAFCS